MPVVVMKVNSFAMKAAMATHAILIIIPGTEAEARVEGATVVATARRDSARVASVRQQCTSAWTASSHGSSTCEGARVGLFTSTGSCGDCCKRRDACAVRCRVTAAMAVVMRKPLRAW